MVFEFYLQISETDLLKILIQCLMFLKLDMEAGEENGNNMGLKRQRAPLSDSEDNNCSALGLFVA